MEVTGLVVGVVALFSTCMDILERYDTYKGAGSDQRQLHARLEAEKIKLKHWGEAVGISDGKLATSHDVQLDDPHTRGVVSELLSSIKEILKSMDKTLSRTSPKLRKHEGLANLQLPSQDLSIGASIAIPRSTSQSLVRAFGGKDKVLEGVQTIHQLVDSLYDLIPIYKLHRQLSTKPGGGADTLEASNGPDFQEMSAVLSEKCKIAVARWRTGAARKDCKMVDEWLNLPPIRLRFEELLETRLSGTCDWILRTNAYTGWFSADRSPDLTRILWVHGPAGHGKTILCSRMVQELKDCKQAFAYSFVLQAEAAHELEIIIGSWISQLVRSCTNAREIVTEYIYRSDTAVIASHLDMWTVLSSIVSGQEYYTLVVDGLDECQRSNSNRRTFLHHLQRACKGARILITSRDEIDIRQGLSDIESQINTAVLYEHSIKSADVRYDLTAFARDELDRKMPLRKPALRSELADLMVNKSDGMFLWIKLQKDLLRASSDKKVLRKTIEDMPSGLSAAYDRSWSMLLVRSLEDRERAGRILAWVLHGFRPLTAMELADALETIVDDSSATDPYESTDSDHDESSDDEVIAIDQRYIDDELIDICSSMIEVRAGDDKRPGTRTLHPVHFSVKEYMCKQPRIIPFSNGEDFAPGNEDSAHQYLAETCLSYLNQSSTWRYASAESHTGISGSFLYYAATSWHKHLRRTQVMSQSLRRITLRFLRSTNPAFLNWRQRFAEYVDQIHPLYSPFSNPITPMYIAALCNLTCVMKALKTQSSSDLNIPCGRYGTPLQAACSLRNREAFDLLLEWNADVNIVGGMHSSALHSAVAARQDAMVFELLRLNVDVKATTPGGNYWTVIHYAAYAGSCDIVAMLLAKGADIQSKDRIGQTPLYLASRHGHVDVVRYLLAEGADYEASTDDGNNPLIAASEKGHAQVVRDLLGSGASIRSAAKDGCTPLLRAVRRGRVDVVKILLDARRQISLYNGSTPHCAAASPGRSTTVVMLPQQNGDQPLDVHGHDLRKPLVSAVYSGYPDITQVLLDAGPDYQSIIPPWNHTILHEACQAGQSDIVAYLIELGADINARNILGETPVGMAASCQHETCVRVLKSAGADLKLSDCFGRSALYWIAVSPRLPIDLYDSLITFEQHCSRDEKERFVFAPEKIWSSGLVKDRNTAESAYGKIGRGLLHMGLSSDARIAFELQKLAYDLEGGRWKYVCDGCDCTIRRGHNHACMVCANVNFCSECCWNDECQFFRENCRDHKISVMSDAIDPDLPDSATWLTDVGQRMSLLGTGEVTAL